jgi:trk system potassium uptake protein TrkH
MGKILLRMPIFLLLVMAAGASMIIPAVFGGLIGEYEVGRGLFYTGILILIASWILALASNDRKRTRPMRSQLLVLVCSFLVLPVIFAAPLVVIGVFDTWQHGYFEFVSAFTTTGATTIDEATTLKTVQLWRAQVGWMGGFLVWVFAAAIFYPLNLAGYELLVSSRSVSSDHLQSARSGYHTERFIVSAQRMALPYVLLTVLLWLFLVVLGEHSFVALCHAMSTLSTSGISPVDGMNGASVGMRGEIIVALFLLFALSYQLYGNETARSLFRRLVLDRELRGAIIIVLFASLALFILSRTGGADAARAVWGAVFTSISFLTTAGFVSAYMPVDTIVGEISPRAMILISLALIGGGIATTAGGIKLLRVYVLFRHGALEMNRLIYPSWVGGKDQSNFATGAAFRAWTFFMLFCLSLVISILAVSATGADFDTSLVTSISALTTTGPAAPYVLQNVSVYADLGPAAQTILAATMILGRVETLVVIALLNPEFWR